MSARSAQTVRVGIAQYAIPTSGDRPVHHEQKVLDAVSGLGKSHCDVIALPELCTTAYFPAGQDENAFSLAKGVDDPFVRRVADLASAHGTDILLPIFEDAGEGVCYNSVLFVSRTGEIAGRYRKIHVPAVRSFEKYYFRPGSRIPSFRAVWGDFGCLLCQDRFFPEASRVLALQGACVIFILNASADYARFAETWEAVNVTRAYENGCFVVAVNRCGTEGEIRFFGDSMILAPDGRVIERADDNEASIVTDIDLGEVRRFRHTLQMYRDYRPELYQPIVTFTGMNDD